MSPIVVLLLLSVAIYGVSCTSPIECTGVCDHESCPAVGDCSCGSHRDECDCCEFCNKCPGDECDLVAQDVCQFGTCQLPEGKTFTDALSGVKGHCPAQVVET